MRTGTRSGFSLVEVALALGICAFVLVAMLALFQVGLKSSRESEEQMEAANLASQIMTLVAACPTNGITIPSQSLTNSYADVFGGTAKYIGPDGRPTNVNSATYRITCSAGTNAATGSRMAQVYLMLSWPPRAALTGAVGKYETIAYIPLP